MDIAQHIISLERGALDRWIRADPDGYLSLYAIDATYFDPFCEKRVDGLDELNAQIGNILIFVASIRFASLLLRGREGAPGQG